MPEKLLVVRPKKITPEQGKEIVSRAKYYLSLKIPFDHIGTIDEPSKLYCSELIYQILDHDLHLVSSKKEKRPSIPCEHSMTLSTLRLLSIPTQNKKGAPCEVPFFNFKN